MGYKYTIDGKTYRSDTELSDADLEELGGHKRGNQFIESGKQAIAKGVASIPALASVAGNFLALEPDVTKDYSRIQKAVQEPVAKFLGATGQQPETGLQKIVGTGLDFAVDPVNRLFPIGTAQKFAPWAREGINAATNFFTGAGSEIGGMLGKQAGGEGGEIAGKILGGGATNVAATQIPRTLVTASTAMPTIRNFVSGITGNAPNDQVVAQAGKKIEQVFLAAASADPNFLKTLEEALVAQQQTGVKLPTSSLLADNAVINTAIASLAKTHPEFRQKYFAQFEDAKQALIEKSKTLFGDPAQANKILSGSISDVNVAKSANQRVTMLNKQAIAESAKLQTIEPASFGAKVVSVTEAAEKQAKESTRPLYKEAFAIGEANNVHLSAEAVGDIHNFVVGQEAGDIFKTFPGIYSKVLNKFKPATTEGSGLVDAMGKPIGTQASEQFAKASLEDLDSLKREINLQLRKTDVPSEIRVLSELKTKLNSHIDGLDANFVSAYKGADAAYLAKVGLPFDEATINMIDRAKFNENVIPLLTKNKSTLSQFIEATGDKGVALAEKAFVSSLANFAVKDGVLETKLVSKWMKDHGNALELLPNAKARILEISGNVKELQNSKLALNDAFIKQSQAKLLQLEGKDAQTIVNNLYSSTAYTDKFMAQHAGNPDTLRAIKSFMMDDLLKSGNPLELLNDRTKAITFNRVFGATYADKVKQLATIADRVTHDPSAIAPSINAIEKGTIENTIGTGVPGIISKITNPFYSARYAATSLLSRFFARQTSKAVDQQMIDILTDQKAFVGLFNALQPRIEKDAVQVGKDLLSVAKKHGFNWLDMLAEDAKSGALKSAYDASKPQEQQQEQPQ